MEEEILKLIYENRRVVEIAQTNEQLYYMCSLIKKTLSIEGDIAELGVWKGGTARLICKLKGDKSLHLFDTFEGLPIPTEEDIMNSVHGTRKLVKGEMVGALEDVKKLLSEYPNVYYYKGLFPDTTKPIENKKFSFIHLDADLYISTLNALNFFYPRMNKGAILLSHDYDYCRGVNKAFNMFMENKEESLVIIKKHSQCYFIKK